MKELIGKLSRGIVEYNVPQIETSITNIEMTIEEGHTVNGNFDIYCNPEQEDFSYEIKGIVYSTHDALIIENNQFIGKKHTINYTVSAKSYEAGMNIDGKIEIVSNAGEVYIPFTILVEAESITSSIGKISNIFHFVNLVQEEYEEALKLFNTSSFINILLKKQLKERCMYEGLIKSYDKKCALEEFIIGINKKQVITYSISETEKKYESLDESYGDKIIITRDNWGYQDIHVEIIGDFITKCKKLVTSEDFAGNRYEYEYLIDAQKLHAGNNYGKIVFQTISQKLECSIVVENTKQYNEVHKEVNKCLAELLNEYLNFRLKKKGTDQWSEKSLQLVERARGFDDKQLFLKILHAQLCLIKKRDDEASWLLESVANELMDNRDEHIETYCYYLYVRTLQKRELEQTLDAIRIIRQYYENGHDSWRLLWILLYMDRNYENNKSLKLTRIKEQFNIGCKSPLMYYEALYVLNRQPALLRVINNFELQVLSFASKYDAIELRLAVQISELCMHEKTFRPLLFEVLTTIYNKFENKVILTAIISILIRSNKRDSKYFCWYKLAVEADVKVTRLYEYYVYSMDENYKGVLPNTVLMYFKNNGSILNDKESFFYYVIINNKDRFPHVYKSYRQSIERFAVNELRQAFIDKYMAVIYKDILTKEYITDENVCALLHVLGTWLIKCQNPFIEKVIIIHKEICEEAIYHLIDGEAYVQIYTEDAIVLFEDGNSNRYMNNIEYTIEPIYSDIELKELSIKRNCNHIYAIAQACEQSLKYHKHLKSGVSIFQNVMKDERFRKEYCDNIMKEIVEYYVHNYEGDDLDDYLKSIEISRLSLTVRNKILQLMILRGLYNEASEILKNYGLCDMDASRILKYCSRVLKDKGDSLDNHMLNYCIYAFRHGKYNEETLTYLCKYFNGMTKEMLELFRISKEFVCENRDFEERIIAQMLFTGSHTGSIVSVYESYYRKGALELIKKAYLFFEAYEYFVRENPIDDLYFTHLEDVLYENEKIFNVCKCAYLKYCSKKEIRTKKQIHICSNLIKNLENSNIVFDFYRKFENDILLSENVIDKTTIEYRSDPKKTIYIHYYIDTGEDNNEIYQVEKMTNVLNGLFIKTFTIFYGESVKYYITEEQEENVCVTESSKYILDDRNVETNASKFGMINDILVCAEMKDEKMVSELAIEYYETKMLTEALFC